MPLRRPPLNPNLGLYLDRVPLAIPPRALKACRNVRIKNGQIMRDNMGWGPFPDEANALDLKDPVVGIDSFFPRSGGQHLLFATTRDIYRYVESDKSVVYLTPRYETGTVDVTNGSTTVAGNGTAWQANVKPGDFIHIGEAGQTDPSAEWLEIDAVTDDGTLVLAESYSGATDTNLNYTIRRVFTGDMSNIWSFASFPQAEGVAGGDGDRWYATNGVSGEIVAWDGTADQVYFPDLGDLDSAQWITRYKNMLIYGNIVWNGDARQFSILASAIGEPENITDGHEMVVHDGIDPIIQAVPLGDNLVIYGERSITLAQFVGGDVAFVFRNVISGIGLIAPRAFADFGDFHQFLGPDAQYRFDGITVQEVGYQVWREIIRQQSPQRISMIHAHFDEENGELLWIVPLTTDTDPESGPPETAFVEHYLEMVGENDPSPFTVRDLPATATGFFEREATLTWDSVQGTWAEQNFRWNDRFLQGAFPINLFGTADGKVMILNERDSRNGEPLTSFARFGRLPLGDIRRKGTVTRIYPFAERLPAATYGLDVRLYTGNDPAGDVSLAGTYSYDLTQSSSRHFVSPRKTARYCEIEFRTSGVSRPFFIHGYDMDIVPAGER